MRAPNCPDLMSDPGHAGARPGDRGAAYTATGAARPCIDRSTLTRLGTPRTLDLDDAHGTVADPALDVEVALSGLRRARGRKARAYARNWLDDYWIVNLVDRVLEVHREPARRETASPRWAYASITTLGAGDVVTPLAAPAARIRVADLLP